MGELLGVFSGRFGGVQQKLLVGLSIFVLMLSLGFCSTGFAQGCFIRGDVNFDGVINNADVDTLIAIVAGGAPAPCLDAADVNDDGIVTTADAGRLILYLGGAFAIPPPSLPDCGPDPTPDILTCNKTFRGDLDLNGHRAPNDLAREIFCIFAPGIPGNCGLCPADINGDGRLSGADLALELLIIFAGVPVPVC